MKFNLFSLALIVSFYQTIAQSSLLVTHYSNSQLPIANNGIIYITTSSNSSESTIINIKNTSATTKFYKLKRYDDVLNTGAYALFEVGSIGYVPSVTITPLSVTLTANGTINDDLLNQNELYKLNLMENVTTGISHIRYEIFDINNINDIFTFTIYYNDFASSVNEGLSKSIIVSEFYPNPSSFSSSINISTSEFIQNLDIVITNNIGEIVSSQQINLQKGENNITIHSESFYPGIYYATSYINKTKVVKKFIVEK